MKNLAIEDLVQDIELDREAMAAIVGSGLWGSVKKYARKSGRYIKRKVKSKINTYRQLYRVVRGTPSMFYSSGKTIYRSAKRGFGLW